MKLLYTLTAICITTAASSQVKFHIGYATGAPLQEMNKNINLLHSINFGGSYQLPGALKRVDAGIDLSWGMYANASKEQTFTFSNGSTTRTNVNYSSNVTQFGLGARVRLLEDKALIPYVNGKLGYATYYSNIFIEDPADPHGCRALDNRSIIRDGTFTAAYGGGLLIDFASFTKYPTRGRKWIDLSINHISGSNIEYINTRKLYDAANPPAPGDGKPLNVKFINATTNEIHEHQVAEVFDTPLRMLEIKLSAVFTLSNK